MVYFENTFRWSFFHHSSGNFRKNLASLLVSCNIYETLEVLCFIFFRSAVLRVVTITEGLPKKIIATLRKRWCRDILVLFFTTLAYPPKGTAAKLNDAVIYILISKLTYRVAEISCHI
jgi:hypothetical protein